MKKIDLRGIFSVPYYLTIGKVEKLEKNKVYFISQSGKKFYKDFSDEFINKFIKVGNYYGFWRKNFFIPQNEEKVLSPEELEEIILRQ
jgi:hypothetical protein